MPKVALACGVLSAAALLACAEPALAANAEGAVMLSLSTTLVGYSKLSYTLELPRPLGDTPGTISALMFGPSANPVSIEAGYHVSDMVNLGLLLEIGSSTLSTESKRFDIEESEMLARFLIGPRVELVFGSDRVRPFTVAAVGFTTAPRQDDDPQQDVSRTVRFSGAQALLGAGLHWFLTKSFSIDPAVRVGFGMGRGSVDQEIVTKNELDMNVTTVYNDVQAGGTLVTASAVLGLSGWIP